MSFPLTPYAGTSGWRGSEASLQRVLFDDADGSTAYRQNAAMEYLKNRRLVGISWKEFGELENLHAGQASAALSVLHKEGLILRLVEKRNRCSIYVLPIYVAGRETSQRQNQGKKKSEVCAEILAILDKNLTNPDTRSAIYKILNEEME